MNVGDMVKSRHVRRIFPDRKDAGDYMIGIIIKIHLRDLDFYKSHTYLVFFEHCLKRWCVDIDFEVIS